MLTPKTRDTLKGFVIGDAIGEPYEFRSPVIDEITERWKGRERLRFTDDTYLVLSSVHALRALTEGEQGWVSARQAALEYLLNWYRSGDLRGIGLTTTDALRQLARHEEALKPLSEFKINPIRGYDFANSAGNGVLSRALPFLLQGHKPGREMRAFLELTHLHPDGFESVGGLSERIVSGNASSRLIRPDAKGFWCVEALVIAERAVAQAKTSLEAFILSQRPGGDNDSTAALALALWVHDRGWDRDLERIYARLEAGDLERLGGAGV